MICPKRSCGFTALMSSATVSTVVLAGPVAVTAGASSATPVLTVSVIFQVSLPVVTSIVCPVPSTLLSTGCLVIRSAGVVTVAPTASAAVGTATV